ncbi:MAG: hypothetical protein QM817_20260 [Archangium sp.]
MVPFLVLSLVVADVPGDLSKAAGCSDDRPCTVTTETKAGTDGSGQPLRVYQLSRGPKESESGAECEQEEYWLATGSKGRKLRQLFTLCNDGYGSASAGEDDVKVKPNRVFHEQFGGAEIRWVVTREVQLSPLTLVSTTVGRFSAVAGQFIDETKWNWDTFSGERTRAYSKCLEDAQPDLREELKPKPVRSAAIPKIAVTKQWVEQGWKESSLGTCSARAIYLLQGSPSSVEGDTVLRVMAISDTEFVFEITDDTITKGDQLALWLGEQNFTPWEGCLGKQGPEAAQWIISLPSGESRPGQNARFGGAKAEVVQQGTTLHVKMKLPEGVWTAMTFTYADSDDGKTVKRIVSTSQLVAPQTATLSALHAIERRTAICEVSDGVLTPRRPPLPAKGALLPGFTGGK